MNSTPANYYIRCEEVTPAMASAMLDRDKHRQMPRPKHVAALAGAIKKGEWEVTTDPIKIREDGAVMDGVHRLAAVVESGMHAKMLILYGIPNSVPVFAKQSLRSGSKINQRIQ